MKRNRTINYKVIILLIIVFAFAFSLQRLILIFLNNAREKDAYDTVQSLVSEDPQIETITIEETGDVIMDKYKKLYFENPDIYGWIKLNGTEMNYPVMYTPAEPEYYLRRSFYKEEALNGVPFIGPNHDESGKNTIIYGHNMTNGTMFSPLFKYKDKDFWNENKIINYDTLYETGEYEVFAICNTDVRDAENKFSYNEFTDLSDNDRFIELMDLIDERKLYDTGVNVTSEDELLTLSTCSYHTLDGRYVVFAKKINN